MTYPEFETDLLVGVKPPFSDAYVDEYFIKLLDVQELSVGVMELQGEGSYPKDGWISEFSQINLFVSDKFIDDQWFKNAPDLVCFAKSFQKFIEPSVLVDQQMRKGGPRISGRPHASLSLFYKDIDLGLIFRFLFDFDGIVDDYIKGLSDSFKSICSYRLNNNSRIHRSIEKTHISDNRVIHLIYLDGTWVVDNPLQNVTRELNDKYREGQDHRIRKPEIMIHHNDYRKYFTFGKKWVLESDKLETIMTKPNDVSIYSSICDRHTAAGKKFYDSVIKPRFKRYHGSFPSEVQHTEYYNYFEYIISAIIFAYTAVEAFVNICISERYQYSHKGKMVSREEVERYFPLRDKLKLFLVQVLDTPNPSQEPWCSFFIDLEEIRDEVIHTKQSKSEDRYSQFLTKRIFKIIEVHKIIIRYYAKFINDSGESLLNQVPYNFGYDEIRPSLMNDRTYDKLHETLNNPSKIYPANK